MTSIPIEDAIATRFENSTREELLDYCEQLGIGDVRQSAEMRSLKDRILAQLGMVERTPGEVTRTQQRFSSKILPDVNLTPQGRWGGRRRRVRVPRPTTATKSERAIPVGWNGKATFWIPFDEPCALPWPIYQILMQTRSRRAVQKEVDGPNGIKEITTAWEFDDFMLVDYGDDPSTAELPSSLTGWYQDKGPEFYRGLSERDLTTVAGRLDINIIGHDRRRMAANEILDQILIFLFGFAADSIEQMAEEAHEVEQV